MRPGLLFTSTSSLLVASCSSDLPTAPEVGAYYVLSSYYGHSLPYTWQPPQAGDTTYGVLLGDQFHIESDKDISWASYGGTAHVQSDGRITYSAVGCEFWVGRYSLKADTLINEESLIVRPFRVPFKLLRRKGQLILVDTATQMTIWVYTVASRPLPYGC